MSIDFTNVWPYNEIKAVTVDGQEMVYIPKIYVRNTMLPKTSKYAGKWQYCIGKERYDKNWHIHPAFMNQGKEMSGIEIAAYTATKDAKGKAASVKDGTRWTSITRDGAHALAMNRNVSGGTAEQQGWHCYNIYEHHLICRLMLIEYGTADLQTMLTGTKTGNNATWRGIHELFGGTTIHFWIDGIDGCGKDGAIRIFDNEGRQTYIDTGIMAGIEGWIKTTFHNTGEKYDMGDVFIVQTADGTESNGSFGDYQYMRKNTVVSVVNNATADRGPFCLYPNGIAESSTTCGFKIARFVE